MKTAFLFPGQGSQFAAWANRSRRIFPRARALRAGRHALVSRCRDCASRAPTRAEKNREYAARAGGVSVAAWTVLRRETGDPACVAGHSLGDTRRWCAGSLDFGDALRLVRRRGRYMQEAVPQGVGAMAALLKLPPKSWTRCWPKRAGRSVSAANLNSADQWYRRTPRAVERAMALAKAAGAKRAVALRSARLSTVPHAAGAGAPETGSGRNALRRSAHPAVNNWQAREIRTAAEARRVVSPVPNAVRGRLDGGSGRAGRRTMV